MKSNVGHALAAAGALGLAKVLVAAEHGAVPPTLHAAEASPEIDWESQGLRLAQILTPWPAVDGQRIAATSAFGIARHQRACHRRPAPRGRRRCSDARYRCPTAASRCCSRAHDEDLIGQDAAAILRLPRPLRVSPRHRGRGRVRPCCGCGGCGGTARCCGPPTAPSWSAGLSALADGEEHPLVARSSAKRWRRGSRSCFPARATNGSRWAPTPTGDCPPTGLRPTAARRRSSPPGCRRRCRTWWASSTRELVADRDPGSAVHPCGQPGRRRGDPAECFPISPSGTASARSRRRMWPRQISLADAVAVVGARAAVVDRLAGRVRDGGARCRRSTRPSP